jgi:diadenosine tetraphosphate (Ap4A) HIT family hydrolase
MYDPNNVFAKIIRNEIPSKKIYEDDNVFAFEDISPKAPTHILVIPKGEYISFSDFISRATPEIIADFFQKISKIAKELGLEEKGYKLVTNNGEQVGQVVFHFHVHILSGKKMGDL